MTQFTIPDDLAELLDDIAHRESLPVDELIEKALRDYATAVELDKSIATERSNRNPLLVIAEAANELGAGSKEGDISQRSREVLNTDFSEYLMRRTRGDYSDTNP